MLSRLSIKNVALIENAEIEFSEGLNVLSGETGAGKSVILDSLNFVLGAKADKSMIRYGETECFVKAEFLVPQNSEVVFDLQEMDIDSDGEVIISRRFTDAGKNSVKINGNTVTTTMLRKITSKLVDVHGQSEHFFLLDTSNQLKTLDSVCGDALAHKKAELLTILSAYKTRKKQLAELGGNDEERERKIEILKFSIDEITAIDWKDGEEEELLQKRNKINNLEKILNAVREALSCLSGDGGATDALYATRRSMNSISGLDGAYEEISDRIESLIGEAEDTVSSLSAIADSLYFDENEAENIERRLDEIHGLQRKYAVKTQSQLCEILGKQQEEYELLSNGAEKSLQLQKEIDADLKKIYSICLEMRQLRKSAGDKFSKAICNELTTLNIPHAAFSISFNDFNESDASHANENGLDNVEFMFSANIGEPQKPLGKIISGGEMSRLMLAIKTQLSDINGISTYVFDEIDAGISGKTAKVVGEKFARIAKITQIIAVSHLAQIAVMSDKEFLIEKKEENGKTHTLIRDLNAEEQKEEIVRLLGGEIGNQAALLHAQELLQRAKEYKKTI